MEELVLKSDKGTPITTSLLVAEKFDKRHRDVLRDIENLSCSIGFRERNFALSSYISQQNKELPMHIMSKDGFIFLVMGYTGEKASKFKEDYIDAFNKMEGLVKQVIQNQLYMAQVSARQRFIKSSRIKEIDATINNMMKERRILVKEINRIDRSDFMQLNFKLD